MILAGGTSRRMGRDKLSLEVGGVSLLRRVADLLCLGCEEVLVVGDGGEGAVLPEGCRRIPDLRAGREGPLAGIEAGLTAARYGPVFVAAGDMPFISPELVEFSLDTLSVRGVSAVVPYHGGRAHPLCAAYHRSVLPELGDALDGGVRAVREFLCLINGVCYLEEELPRFGDPDRYLASVNSPDSLEWARAALRGGR